MDAQRGRCAGCGDGIRERYYELDHIVPVSKGGTDTLQNLQLLCRRCNRSKHGNLEYFPADQAQGVLVIGGEAG